MAYRILRHAPTRRHRVAVPLALLAFLHLAACGGGGAAVEGAFEGPIKGRVVTSKGVPVSGATVHIGALQLTTGADGRFTANDVQRPYTAMVTGQGSPHAIVFVGLRRSDPTLEADVSGSGVSRSATVSGTVSGGVGFPQPVNHRARVFENADVSFGGAVATDANTVTGSYGLSMQWAGVPTANAVYRAIQYQYDPLTDLPVTYTGYGEEPTVISTGANVNAISLQPAGTATISGAVSLPSGFGVVRMALAMRHGSHLTNTIFTDNNPMPAFSYSAPVVSGMTIDVEAYATSPAGGVLSRLQQQAANATGLLLDVPQPMGALAPADLAMGVDHTTDFTAEAAGGRLYAFGFRPDDSFHPRFVVYTDQPTTRIPDLSALGIQIPPSATYTWFVETRGPFADIDAAAGSAGIVHANTSSFQTFSGGRAFTTAP